MIQRLNMVTHSIFSSCSAAAPSELRGKYRHINVSIECLTWPLNSAHIDPSALKESVNLSKPQSISYPWIGVSAAYPIAALLLQPRSLHLIKSADCYQRRIHVSYFDGFLHCNKCCMPATFAYYRIFQRHNNHHHVQQKALSGWFKGEQEQRDDVYARRRANGGTIS